MEANINADIKAPIEPKKEAKPDKPINSLYNRDNQSTLRILIAGIIVMLCFGVILQQVRLGDISCLSWYANHTGLVTNEIKQNISAQIGGGSGYPVNTTNIFKNITYQNCLQGRSPSLIPELSQVALVCYGIAIAFFLIGCAFVASVKMRKV